MFIEKNVYRLHETSSNDRSTYDRACIDVISFATVCKTNAGMIIFEEEEERKK
jgi:hypothetical protein